MWNPAKGIQELDSPLEFINNLFPLVRLTEAQRAILSSSIYERQQSLRDNVRRDLAIIRGFDAYSSTLFHDLETPTETTDAT